jgi:hypothetical protein
LSVKKKWVVCVVKESPIGTFPTGHGTHAFAPAVGV